MMIKLGVLEILIILFSKSTATQTLKRQGACNSACQLEIDSVALRAENLYQDQANAHNDLRNEHYQLREVVKSLENDLSAAFSSINSIANQLANLEGYLLGNVSTLNSRITEEIRSTIDFTTLEIGGVRAELNSRINDLTAVVNSMQNNGNFGGLAELYRNVTIRMDRLEYEKIYNLTLDNTIWRKNFRVVNATFEKMKSNNCLCK